MYPVSDGRFTVHGKTNAKGGVEEEPGSPGGTDTKLKAVVQAVLQILLALWRGGGALAPFPPVA